MQLKENIENQAFVYQAGDEILIVRSASIERSMLTADKELVSGGWFAVQLDEIGETIIERYQKLPA